jgi:hypothetical protein
MTTRHPLTKNLDDIELVVVGTDVCLVEHTVVDFIAITEDMVALLDIIRQMFVKDSSSCRQCLLIDTISNEQENISTKRSSQRAQICRCEHSWFQATQRFFEQSHFGIAISLDSHRHVQNPG